MPICSSTSVPHVPEGSGVPRTVGEKVRASDKEERPFGMELLSA